MRPSCFRYSTNYSAGREGQEQVASGAGADGDAGEHRTVTKAV